MVLAIIANRIRNIFGIVQKVTRKTLSETQKFNAEISVPFNVTPHLGTEISFINEAILNGRLSGDWYFTRKCEQALAGITGSQGALLTSSGTHALEIVALVLDIKPGDEIIMPSFTFASTANAFALRGAVPVFVDVRADTMNIDENLVKEAITPRTRAVVVVHYGGVACQMDRLLEICSKNNLFLVEDAAHAIGASWLGQPLGSIGDFGAFSFHNTKNLTSGGEGGMICVREPGMIEPVIVCREKGTNRNAFSNGKIARYEWVELGSSYLMNEISAAYLWAQLQCVEEITRRRREICESYRKHFSNYVATNRIEIQHVPNGVQTSGHLFFMKMRDETDRFNFIKHLRKRGVVANFHYSPLHSSPAGRKYGRLSGEDNVTTRDSLRLVRLPVFSNMNAEQQEIVCQAVQDFFVNNP